MKKVLLVCLAVFLTGGVLAQAPQFPGWTTLVDTAINCGVPGQPACRITGGTGCATTVPGQCSFPKATAHAQCAAHGKCRALTCNAARSDCQARDADEARNPTRSPGHLSFVVAAPPPAQASVPGAASAPNPPSGNPCTGGAVTAPVFAALKELPLKDLPISTEGIQGNWAQTVDGLRSAAVMDSSGYCVAQRGRFQLHFTLSAETQSAFLAYAGTLAFPNGKWNQIGNIAITAPIFSLALEGGSLDIGAIAPGSQLRGFFNTYYAGLTRLQVDTGVQVFGRAAVSGRIADSLLKPVLNMPLDKGVWLRAGQSREMPEYVGSATNAAMSPQTKAAVRGNLVNRAAAFSAGADQIARAGTDGGDGALFLEIKMPPDNRQWPAPLGINDVTVSDATVYVEQTPVIRFSGNLSFQSANNKTFVTYAELPFLQGTSTLDASKVQLGLATPGSVTLGEFAAMSVTLSAETNPAGNLLGRILASSPAGQQRVKAITGNLAKLAKPLSFFTVTNPAGQVRFSAGGAFPPISAFNIFLLGKAATAPDKEQTKGALVAVKGGLRVFGQTFANTDTRLTETAFTTVSDGSLTLPLDAVGLGKPGVRFKADVYIDGESDLAKQRLVLDGSIPGKSIDLFLSGTAVAVSSPASCAFPVSISGSVSQEGFPGNLPAALKGVNVDPVKLADCTGEALKAAYRWIGGAGKALGGYTAEAAGAALKGINEGAAAVEEVAENAGKAAYNGAWTVADTGQKKAVEAAKQAADQVKHFGNDVGGFFKNAGGAFKDFLTGNSTDKRLEKACNWRPKALADRGNTPTYALIDDFAHRVYGPIQQALGRAGSLRGHARAVQGNWARSDQAFDALSERWNQTHKGKDGLKPYRQYHDASAPLPRGVRARWPQGLDSDDFRPPGASPRYSMDLEFFAIQLVMIGANSEYAKWVGWKNFMGDWRPSRYTMTLIHRCAEADVANVPNRMAKGLRTFLPLNKGDPSAEAMTHENYIRLIGELERHVKDRNALIDARLAWLGDFIAAWRFRSADFRDDVLERMSLGPWAQMLADGAETKGRFAPLWKDYHDAIDGFSRRTERMLNMEDPASRAEAVQLLDRVVLAGGNLRKAAVDYRRQAPAEIKNMLPAD